MKTENEITFVESDTIISKSRQASDVVYHDNSLDVFMNEIGQIDLLTKEEEIKLATQVMIARDSTDEKIIKLGKEARDRLILSNLRLVVSIAKKYKYTNVSFMDLIQEGVMGLMIAVDRYQVYKKFRLSTFATWWIKQTIKRSISNTSRTIRLPEYIFDLIAKVRKARKKHIIDFGFEPDNDVLSNITGISKDLLRLIEIYDDNPCSLDRPLGEEGNTRIEITPDVNNPNPDEYDKLKIIEEFVIDSLEFLSERERRVIKMRYGIDSEEKTLEEIGEILGITRERVRQIENGAIKKLRRIMNIKKN